MNRPSSDNGGSRGKGRDLTRESGLAAEFAATAVRFERLAAKSDQGDYELKLFVTGMTDRSLRAIQSLRAICNEHLSGRYQLEILDIRQHPELTRDEQVIAAPTLVKKQPLPLRRIIGDLSDTARVLSGLGLKVSTP